MGTAGGRVGQVVLRHLRSAREPVREAALFARVQGDAPGLAPDAFLALMEDLATGGHVHVAVEHDMRADDPAPFGPRFWRVTQ